jgi:hypothetical protein
MRSLEVSQFSRFNLQRVAMIAALGMGAVALMGSAPPREPLSDAIVGARAFVITDQSVLAPFTWNRVVTSLKSTTSADTTKWLATLTARESDSRPQRVRPFSGFIAAPIDGYWEPAGAGNWSYIRPIAIVNRFDLVTTSDTHCGEYRLIFSQRNGSATRLHIAVEISLRNPYPHKGKAGCASIATFWWDLAGIASAKDRGARLEDFFFRGLPATGPVLNPCNFEQDGSIRTSEVGDGRPRFRQFALRRHCASGQPCVARLTRIPLDNMPHAVLFDASRGGEHAVAFRLDFLRQVASLSLRDVNRISMNLNSNYGAASAESVIPVFNYRLPFRRSLNTVAGQRFREQIAEELRRAGSTLTPEDLIGRAETQNCVGCHGKPGPIGDGVVFPKAFESCEHKADDAPLKSARISPALERVFVPYRIQVLSDYLRARNATVRLGSDE